MKRLWLGAGVGFLALLADPAVAQKETPVRWQALSEQELGQHLGAFLQQPMTAPCSTGVAVAQEVKRRHPERPQTGALVSLARMYCAWSREQKEETLSHYLAFEAYGVMPFDPFLGLYLAGYADNRDEQLRQMRRILLESAEPVGTGYARTTMGLALRDLDRAERGDELGQVALAAARAGRLETIGNDYASAIALRALRAAVTDAPDFVPELLNSITYPTFYQSLLADRRYAPIWPQVQERAGAHLGLVLQAEVDRTLARLAAEPDNAEALNEAAYAQHFAKRNEDVIAMVEQWRSRPDAPDEIDEDLAWAINLQGFALSRLGRSEEADAVMAEIAALDESRHGWVVNFAINHASRIVGDGRYEQGLPAVDRARVVADRQGSTYARLLVARDRACALTRLGRHEEALGERAYLMENLDDSLGAAGTGLLCLGLRSELVDALKVALADENRVRENYLLLQRPEADLFYLPSELPSVAAVVQEEPELRALMEQHLRVIPDEFIPLQ